MHLSDISKIRLASQHVTHKKWTTVKELVDHMGAVQAQDYPMAKWAVGKRLTGITDKTVDDAITKGEIFRTHVLRPTWHFVSSDDIYRLLELTAPHIKSSVNARHRQLELSEPVLTKIYTVIEKALRDGNHLTRDELYSKFDSAGISTYNNRGAHILLCAELEEIVCSGKIKGKKQTYALLGERLPKPARLTRDEVLEMLAKKYFSSHGPATLRDFVWWSGLPVRDAKRSIEMLGNEFTSITIDTGTYWLSKSLPDFSNSPDLVLLLPAFDEFLIAYTDRKASIGELIQKKAISNNGIFRPIVVVNGQVAGIWKRTIKKDNVIVDIDLFSPLKKRQIDLIENEVASLGYFMGIKTELNK